MHKGKLKPSASRACTVCSISATILLVVPYFVLQSSTLSAHFSLPSFFKPRFPGPPTSSFSLPAILTPNPTPRPESDILLETLQALPSPEYRPYCELNSTRLPPIEGQAVYIALNLLSAQHVLPTFMQELPVLIRALGPENVFLSVVENGSEDKTPGLLFLLSEVMDHLGVMYQITIRGPTEKPSKQQSKRIPELAAARNAAMEPLYSGRAALALDIRAFDMVLFMNDIIWCATDMLEIIHEHLAQRAHFTCAPDYESHLVADRWAARLITGDPLYPQSVLRAWFATPPKLRLAPPFPPEPFPADGGAMQVFTCWNGAVVLDARAFDGAKGVRFRTARGDEDAGKASERFLLGVDFWRRGMTRAMLVPKASVAYDLKQYDVHRTSLWSAGTEPPGTHRIEWIDSPPERVLYHDYERWAEPERPGRWDEA